MPQDDQALLTRLDLDVCCPLGEENVRLIDTALHDLHPVHRTANKLPLAMTRGSFGELKNLYLQTDLGKLDCLGEVSGVGNFGAVLKNSIMANFSYGTFRFLNLDALIASKKAVGRERDLSAVRQLLAIKERNEQ